MPRRTEPYTFADMDIFVTKASRLLVGRYSRWGVEDADIQQELWLKVYADESKYRRWLSADPQQTTRIFRSLYDAGRKYAEREKASRVGYHPDDVQWYTPSLVEAILPFALDSEWNGMIAEHGGEAKQNPELITMVLDVRRAIDKTRTEDRLLQLSPGQPAYEDAVRSVVDALGGARHFVGRRRVVPNSTAQHFTDMEEAS